VLEEEGEDWLDSSCEKRKKYYVESRRRGISYIQYKEGWLTGLATSCIGAAF